MSIPVGFYLFGLNVTRRGGRVMGLALTVLSATMFLAMSAAGMLGIRVSNFALVGIIAALGLYQFERGPYRRALALGGMPARWWPPLLWVVGIVATMALIATLFVPELLEE